MFMLCAADARPLVSVPVVIVSTTRQGGCTCENISGLRIGTYNLEFTALYAPKPLLLISANDDTRTMPERGFPELKQHYRMLGATQNVSHIALLQFPNNYNYVSRAAMYRWLIDTARFRFADIKDVYDVNFVPGAAKYDDLPGVSARRLVDRTDDLTSDSIIASLRYTHSVHPGRETVAW